MSRRPHSFTSLALLLVIGAGANAQDPARVKSAVNRLEAKLDQIESFLRSMENAEEQKATAETAEANNENAKLAETHRRLLATYQKLDQENQRLRAHSDKVTAQLRDAEREAKALRAEQKKTARLMGSSAENNEKELHKLHDILRLRESALVATKNELMATRSEKDKLRHDLETLRSHVASGEDKLAATNRRLAEMAKLQEHSSRAHAESLAERDKQVKELQSALRKARVDVIAAKSFAKKQVARDRASDVPTETTTDRRRSAVPATTTAAPTTAMPIEIQGNSGTVIIQIGDDNSTESEGAPPPRADSPAPAAPARARRRSSGLPGPVGPRQSPAETTIPGPAGPARATADRPARRAGRIN